MGGILAGDNDLSFYIHNLAEQFRILRVLTLLLM